VAREKDFMKEKDEKKANAEAKKKKMCQTEDEKKRRGRFFRPLFFLSFPFQIKILVKESALLSALLRFSFFSLGVFIRRTSRWSRARARIYISRNARSRRVSLERRDEKKREKERKRRARETTIPEEKGKRKKERSNRFFGAKVV